VVGGIDCTESAAAAGDEYKTRDILLTQGFATTLAGLCGGVLQNTPYIGHPAYKRMGGRAAYTLALGLLIGLLSVLGVIPYFVSLVPEAALAPILIFIGLEITSQAFHANPDRHYTAVSLAFIPVIGFLLFLYMNSLMVQNGISVDQLSPDLQSTYRASMVLGNGFILSAMLWSGMLALLIDVRVRLAGLYMVLAGVLTLFGFIHSTFPDGRLFLPWQSPSPLTFHIFGAYLSLGLLFYIISYIPLGRDE
jgi:AGZA family xanthine/uracil permease-like MFS transporter